MRGQTQLVSSLVCFSFVVLGLAQETPAPTAAHGADLRLATDSRLRVNASAYLLLWEDWRSARVACRGSLAFCRIL